MRFRDSQGNLDELSGLYIGIALGFLVSAVLISAAVLI